MAIDYVEGIFIIANTLVSLYIVIYAFIFLARTKDYSDRRPWELLFVGSLVFLLSQFLTIANIYNEIIFYGMSIETARLILIFVYSSFVLIAFITQSRLILLSDMILITRKVGRRKEEEYSKDRRKPPENKHSPSKKMTPDEEMQFELEDKDVKEEMKEENFHPEIKSEKELIKEDPGDVELDNK